MRKKLDPREVARSRSRGYVAQKFENADPSEDTEVMELFEKLRSAFEAGFYDAYLPLDSSLDTAEAQIDMLKEQLAAEREARLRAEQRALAAAQLPAFVRFPSTNRGKHDGEDILIRLDQIAAVTKTKVYLTQDALPFADLEDPRKVLEAVTLEIAKALRGPPAPTPSRVIVPEKEEG